MDDLVERLEAALGETSPLSSCYLMEEAADEIRSLRAQVAQERAGIVAMVRSQAEWHDQRQREFRHLRRENEALRAQVEQWVECAMYDATMEGPVFKGWDRSALDRCRKRHEDKDPRS